MKTTHNVSTKPDKDGDEKETVLILDWPDGIHPNVMKLAASRAIVKLQGQWRKNGIPPKHEASVVQLGSGEKMEFKPTVEGLAAKAETMSKEEREKLIKQLQLMKDIR